tara:strand:+ start:61 stop:417 length:357 start_codon:yes stop_codon:yes gene_type:complete
MKKKFKYSILNLLGRDIMIHIILPISMVIIAILGYISGVHYEPVMIGLFISLKLALIVINYFNYTSYPKGKRMKLHFEWLPVFGGPMIVFDKHFGFIIPFCMFGIDFSDVYNFKKQLI